MTKTEGGQEQELVLGNKQLLSAFFIVVALLGVFFTMGYIIGRNTGKETAAAGAETATATPKQTEARSEKPVEPPLIAREPPATREVIGAPEQRANPVPQEIETQPAKPYETSKPYEDEKVAGAVAKPRAAEKTAPAHEKPKVKEPAVATPPPAPVAGEGRHFLQVMAVKRPDAEKVQKILQGHGFPVALRESSKEGLFRVLVGPYEDRPALSKAKDELKGAGFDSIVAR